MVKGGYYPASGQAITMREVLLQELHRLNVKILYEIGIRSIKKEQDSFVFYTKSDTYRAKKCILATGGKSYKKTGSDGSGFLYLDEFSHHVRNLVPALAGLQSNLAFFKKVAGIRAGVCVKSYTSAHRLRFVGNLYFSIERTAFKSTDRTQKGGGGSRLCTGVCRCQGAASPITYLASLQIHETENGVTSA